MDIETKPPCAVLGPAEILTEGIEVGLTGHEKMAGYLARPVIPGPHPAVVVAHELFGVTAHVRDVCERLASHGYVALAPDFYHRSSPGADLPHDPGGRERGFALLHQLRREECLADAAAAVDQLRRTGSARVGMIGLSLGGHVAYLAATGLELAAVAALYPGWVTGTEIGLSRPEPTLTLTSSIRARMLILAGQEDHAVPAGDIQAIEDALSAAGVRHEVVRYPDTPHGFLCDRRDTFRPVAADDAWRRIEALLAEELGGTDMRPAAEAPA